MRSLTRSSLYRESSFPPCWWSMGLWPGWRGSLKPAWGTSGWNRSNQTPSWSWPVVFVFPPRQSEQSSLCSSGLMKTFWRKRLSHDLPKRAIWVKFIFLLTERYISIVSMKKDCTSESRTKSCLVMPSAENLGRKARLQKVCLYLSCPWGLFQQSDGAGWAAWSSWIILQVLHL